MAFQQANHVDARGATFNHSVTTFVASREHTLQNLKPAPMDASDRPECLVETRVDVVKSIQHWAADPTGSQSVFWLHGLAGSGKSTLATTVANTLRESGQLGAFLFFDRDVTERNDPTGVVRTLAYQLGLRDPQIGAILAAVIENTPSITMSPLRLQFIKLIIEPLSSIEESMTTPLVLVLDALDECGNAKQRRSLLAILAAESHKLPANLRMFITSRAEFDIRCAFECQPHVLSLELDINSTENVEDILTYLRHRMLDIRTTKKYLGLEAEWPGKEDIWRLSRRASGLFVWASTASEFIDGHDPVKRLEILLKEGPTSGAESALDALYRTALESAGIWDDADFVDDFRSILGIIVVAKSPLSHSAIDNLLGIDKRRPSMHTISLLACVLGQSPTVRILHPSFADFLVDRKRCGRDVWYIDRKLHHLRIAIKCLERLDGALKRNICGLTLNPRGVHGSLPENLAYASLFWVEHICVIVEVEPSIVEYLDAFLHRHLLHWLEAMSILGRSRETIRLLDDLLDWVKNRCLHQRQLSELIYDGFRLVQTFVDSIEEHPLLVYATALPFSPVDCHLYRTFHEDLTFPRIVGGFQRSWSPLLLVLSGHRNSVSSVAISKDGTLIASGSSDDTIRVWDIALGVETLSPLQGHTLGVYSVAFSPDNKSLVSGSGDATLRLWDVTNGAAALPPFRGHEGAVTSVLFSPDGSFIVSGSADKTIRIWDVVTGIQILAPLRGNQDRISSIAMTPDGSRIVSGSKDGTIRVWDKVLGQELLSWTAHKQPILSVHISPDGQRIASGSADTSIRIWDTFSGNELITPLCGHKNCVSSVVFSPDGKWILSGSEDNTLRIWDTVFGKEVFDALDGHDRYISSVAFSPDAKHVISGSWDHTVRVWDSTILGTKSLRPAQGHRECIFTLAFSPDGTRIVSGSADNTVRVWNAASGKSILPPMQGHNHYRSVTFSSDGKRIVSGSEDGTIRVWDASSGAEIQGPMRHEACVSIVLFTYDNQRIVSGSWDNTIRVWNPSSGAECLPTLRGHEEPVWSVASSQDGKWIVSSSLDKTVRVWNAILGVEVLPPLSYFESTAPSVDFSPDGKQILAYSRENIYVWDTIKRTCISKIKQSEFFRRRKQAIAISSGGWIRNFRTNTTISKLPPTITLYSISYSAAFKESVALGFDSGQLLIIHFPSASSDASLCGQDDDDDDDSYLLRQGWV